jgi:hypothetical protein
MDKGFISGIGSTNQKWNLGVFAGLLTLIEKSEAGNGSASEDCWCQSLLHFRINRKWHRLERGATTTNFRRAGSGRRNGSRDLSL